MQRLSPVSELSAGLLFDPNDGFFNGVQSQNVRDFHLGNWYNPIEYYLGGGYNIEDGAGMPWEVKERDGKKLLCYPCEIRRVVSTMCYGDLEWTDLSAEVTIDSASGLDYTGLAFRYQHSRCYYALVVGRYDKLTLLCRNQEEWRILRDDVTVDRSQIQGITLGVEVSGNRIACSLNGRQVYEAFDDTYPKGSVAVVTYSQAAFCDMQVNVPQHSEEAAAGQHELARARIAKKNAAFPKPVLYHSFKTPAYSSGEAQIYQGKTERLAVFVQSQILIPVPNVGNVFHNTTCITVTDLQGNIRWQLGKPGVGKGTAACYQVFDLDGDGDLELVAAKDFEILVLDFETGMVKQRCPTPKAPRFAVPYTDGPEDYYPHICGDAIYMCDTTGSGKRDGFLIKDRYNNVWGYNNQLQELWTMHMVTGHYPLAFDVNGDGLEEILIGHSCLTPTGELLWRMPIGDHVDQISVDRFTDNPSDPLQIAYCAGEEGFLLVDTDGRIQVKQELGHVQKMVVGHLSQQHTGQQFAIYTLWGDQGIIYALDSRGQVCYAKQIGHQCRIRGVNWVGEGVASLLMDAKGSNDTAFYDFTLDRICGFAPLDKTIRYNITIQNLTGDSRDEVVLVSPEEVLFFTQEDNNKKEIVPMRNGMPGYNHSGYRCDKYVRL